MPHAERFLCLGEVVAQRVLRNYEQGLARIAETAERVDVTHRVTE